MRAAVFSAPRLPVEQDRQGFAAKGKRYGIAIPQFREVVSSMLKQSPSEGNAPDSPVHAYSSGFASACISGCDH